MKTLCNFFLGFFDIVASLFGMPSGTFWPIKDEEEKEEK